MATELAHPDFRKMSEMPIWARLLLIKEGIPFRKFCHFDWDSDFDTEVIFASLDSIGDKGYLLSRDNKTAEYTWSF